MTKPRVRLRPTVRRQAAQVMLHPRFRKQERVSAERIMVMLAGGRHQVKNIIAAIEWDNSTTQVVSNTMKHRDLAYLGARVAALVATEIND